MKLCPICATSFPANNRTCPTHGAVLVETDELPPGTLVRDCYRIVRLIGRGGMGSVYLADHTLLGEPRALKFLSTALVNNPVFVQRFLQEARAAGKLRHPNIAGTLELGQAEDGSLYFSMEYVDGPSLRSVLLESPNGLAPERAFNIARGVASALCAAHALGMVHRDIKPENILLATSMTGSTPVETPKVVDFGIVAIHRVGNDPANQLTQVGSALLTAEYAAPEQWRGTPSQELDGRTDLYSLGCVFFEMLTGKQPFHAESYEGWMEQHVYALPPSPSFLRPELARYPEVDEAVLQLLAKDRGQRPANAECLVATLDRIIARGSGTRSLNREATRNDLFVGMTGSKPPDLSRGRTALDVRTGQLPEPSGWAPSPPVAPNQQTFAPYASQPASGGFTAQSPILASGPAPTYQPPMYQPIAPAIPVAPPQSTKLNWGTLLTVLGVFFLLAIGLVGAIFYLRWKQATAADAVAVQKQVEIPSQPVAEANVAPPPTALPTHAPEIRSTPQPSTATPALHAPKAMDIPSDPVSLAARAIALYNEKDYAQAAALLTQACARGQADSCDYLGYAFQHKLGVDQDYTRAAAAFTKGCEAGSMAACSHQANMLLNHQGVPEDDAHAQSLYNRACEGGFADACQSLGSMYQSGKSIPQNYPRAVALFGKACNGGSMMGCDSLGLMYQHSRGVQQDLSKAASLYEQACKGGIADGCNNLGFMYQRKIGVEQDYSKAVTLYGQACDRGNAFACNNLGIMYQDKEGVPQDYLRAASYYGKACEGGSSNGCSDLGELYRLGNGVPQDSSKARTYLSKGCNLGNQWGCEKLKQVQ